MCNASVSHCVLQDVLQARKKIPNFALVFVLCNINSVVVGQKDMIYLQRNESRTGCTFNRESVFTPFLIT